MNLILYIDDGATVTSGIQGIVVCAIAVNANGHAGCVEYAVSGAAFVGTRVVVHDDSEVVVAIVVDCVCQLDGGPSVGSHGHTSAEHQIVVGDSDPVTAAREGGLVGVNHVNVQATGSVRAGVVECYTANAAGSADLHRSVDLLG